ncbi:ricin B-like lectin [Infundibulicybe gibba]|nr:ricin B-like lectin [Infundibulicybe gibba]
MSVNIQSGRTYKITNVKAGTVMDLSRTDNKWVNGYNWQFADNQKWHVENVNGHWQFRNMATGRYLAIDGTPRDGARLIGQDHPLEWDIYADTQDSSVYRIYVPGWHVPINIDLSDHGNPNPGTPVTLWGQWEGQHQTWRFEQV